MSQRGSKIGQMTYIIFKALFKEYLRWNMKATTGHVIQNGQTRDFSRIAIAILCSYVKAVIGSINLAINQNDDVPANKLTKELTVVS